MNQNHKTGSNQPKASKGNMYIPGVTRISNGYCFSIAHKKVKRLRLMLYRIGEAKPFYTLELDQSYRKGDVYCVELKGLPERFAYLYEADGKVFLDPYSVRLTRCGKYDTKEKQDGSIRSMISDSRYNWEEDAPLKLPFEQVILYQTHTKGFTRHASSKVKAKGTFLGIVEKIPYLLELGINQIELLPVYEFNERLKEDEKTATEQSRDIVNYWGFSDGYYFTPKASYAYGEDAVTEFKDMVKALHRNGIEVVLQFYFPKKINHNLITDCIRYWVMTYHIDGVHLMGEALPVTMLATDPLLRDTKIYHADFPMEQIKQITEPKDKMQLAVYQNDYETDMRRFLKSDEDMLQAFAYHMRRIPKDTGIINFITQYEGFTLYDLVSYDYKHNEENGENNRDGTNYNYSWNCGFEGATQKKAVLELRKKQIKNALVLLLLSQGTPMLLAGDEFSNSQRGNNNPYCQDNVTTWLEWKCNQFTSEIQAFTKQLIHLRKEHPILHPANELRIMDYISCGYPDLSYHGDAAWYPKFDNHIRHMGMMVCGKYAKKDRTKDDNFFYIAFNMHWESHEFGLPKPPKGMLWYIKADTGSRSGKDFYSDGEELLLKNQEQLIASERTIIVLIALEAGSCYSNEGIFSKQKGAKEK